MGAIYSTGENPFRRGGDILTDRQTFGRHDFHRGATDGWGRIYFVTPANGVATISCEEGHETKRK